MAYRVTNRIAVIEFEGDTLTGAEIRCRIDVPLSVFLDTQSALTEGNLNEAFRLFADNVLVGWSLESEDGNVITSDYDGMMSLPFGIAVEIIGAWVKAISTAPKA